MFIDGVDVIVFVGYVVLELFVLRCEYFKLFLRFEFYVICVNNVIIIFNFLFGDDLVK